MVSVPWDDGRRGETRLWRLSTTDKRVYLSIRSTRMRGSASSHRGDVLKQRMLEEFCQKRDWGRREIQQVWRKREHSSRRHPNMNSYKNSDNKETVEL